MARSTKKKPAPKDKGGQPTTLTRAKIKEIADLVRVGNRKAVAARACGVPEGTWGGWIKLGKKKGVRYELFHELMKAIDEADAAHEVTMVNVATMHDFSPLHKNPKQALDVLERRHKGWNKVDKTVVIDERPPFDPAVMLAKMKKMAGEK